jgi:drug/metabolite transporter (DMT)-like permease
MELGFILALCTAVCFGIYPIIQKRLTASYSSLQVLSSMKIVEVVVYVLVVIVTSTFILPKTFLDLFLILIFGVFETAGLLFLLKSYKFISVGETFAVANTYPFFLLILSFLVLHETISILHIIGMIIIFFGILSISVAESKMHGTLKYAFFASLCWTMSTFIMVLLLKQGYSPIPLTLFTQGITGVYIILLLFFYERKSLELKKSYLLPFVSVGILTAIGLLCLNSAIAIYIPAIALSVVSSRIMINLLLGRIFLREKMSAFEVFGIILVILALIVFNFG